LAAAVFRHTLPIESARISQRRTGCHSLDRSAAVNAVHANTVGAPAPFLMTLTPPNGTQIIEESMNCVDGAEVSIDRLSATTTEPRPYTGAGAAALDFCKGQQLRVPGHKGCT
jgi:hypothetical protein